MSTLRSSGRVSLTIRKKVDPKFAKAKYYDPINRVGNTIMIRLGAKDRVGNLYEGDTLVVDERDDVNGHINDGHHVVSLGDKAAETLKNLSYYGALQMEHPKLNDLIRNNPTQNKEVVGAMKDAYALTDVHEDDIEKAYAIGQVLYAVPEKAPKEYLNVDANAYRFVLGSEKTCKKVLDSLGLKKITEQEEALSRLAVGRAHNGKKAGHANCYYTIRY